jgi:hypothetical protein
MVEYSSVRSVAAERSFLARLALNRAILENDYWRLPVGDKGHENFMPVGRGRRTSDKCGEWRSFMVCDHKELHTGLSLKVLIARGKSLSLISICGVIVPSAQSASFEDGA